MGVTMVQPAPAWLRELADARAAYQELLGWPVSVRVGERALVVAVGRVLGAVVMPAALGARVRAERAGCWPPAPVVANRETSRWTFFGTPVAGLPDEPASRVRAVAPGSYVVIPRGAEGWIERPVPHRALPSTSELLALASRLYAEGCPSEVA